MPLYTVTQLVLGFPLGVAANISTHAFNNLLRQLNQRSMEISEKIGDIAGAASNMNMIGRIYFIKKDYATALKVYLQSFMIFSKIGSPNVEVVKGNIAVVREKMPGEEFEAIAKEFAYPGEEEQE